MTADASPGPVGGATADTLQRVVTLRRQRRFSDAERLCRFLLRAEPENREAQYQLGEVLLAAGHAQAAADCFEQLLLSEPETPAVWEGLGLARQQAGRALEAIAAFERVLLLAPQSPLALANLGGLLVETGRHRDAVAALRRAIGLMPKLAGLHGNLGLALAALGEHRDAAAAYEAALALEPSFTRALAGLGYARAAQGDRAGAARYLDYESYVRATEIDPPSGYESVAAFNRALAEVVLQHPTLTRDPAGKTTRIGAQTGELMGAADGPLATLEQVFRRETEAYHDHLRALGPGRFPAPLPDRWWLSAWGTVLYQGGHQDPHNHPGPATSGVYYVQIPAAVGSGKEREQGAIEFGRPPSELGLASAPSARTIVPGEGLLVLFPSYFWHRTIPCQGAQPRISIAFDAWPRA